MIKKFSPFLIVPLVLFFILPTMSHAVLTEELQQKISDTTKQRDALLEEQKKLQAQLDVLNAQGKTLTGAVQSLDATKKKLANDIKITQNKISAANLNIQALENAMSEKEQQISIQERAINESIQKLASYDSHSLISDLLSYKQISEIWTDRETLASLQDDLTTQIDNLQVAKSALSKERELKEKNKNDLVNFTGELSGQKKVVEQTQSAKAKLLAQTKSQEAAYQQLLANNIAQEKKFEADLFAFESQLKIALDPSQIPAAGASILGWPVERINITQRFGKTTDSGRLYASGTHNGVDFGTPVGSKVFALRNGVISGMGNTDDQSGCLSYGRWILIKYDNGLSSIFGHLSSSIVKVGQAVTKGQVVGYSGGMPGAYGSGYSTGPHVHVGLFATQGVRVEQYSTSINCKNVSIPLADPKAYLDPLAYMPTL